MNIKALYLHVNLPLCYRAVISNQDMNPLKLFLVVVKLQSCQSGWRSTYLNLCWPAMKGEIEMQETIK